MAITDHSRYLTVANGLTPERLREQNEEIKRLNDKYDDILIYQGLKWIFFRMEHSIMRMNY